MLRAFGPFESKRPYLTQGAYVHASDAGAVARHEEYPLCRYGNVYRVIRRHDAGTVGFFNGELHAHHGTCGVNARRTPPSETRCTRCDGQ